MTKSLAHRLCLKQQFYSFSMVENKSIMKQLTEIYKIFDDLENIEVKIDDEDKDLFLLISLHRSFENFKETPFMDEVQTNVISREISVKTDLMVKDNGKSLSVPNYGSESRGNSKSKDFVKSVIK